MERFVKKGSSILAPDMIGSGEMGPGDFKGDSYIDNYSHNIWYASMLIGRSIVGIRAGDVVRLTRLLEKVSGIGEVYGFARKEMAPVLLHAAAFDPSITHVAIIESFSSYQSIVMNHYYNSAFIHSTVPGALEAYDLPDLAASLARRKLMMVGTTDGYGTKTNQESIDNELAVRKTAYQSKNDSGQLRLVSLDSQRHPNDLFLEWIQEVN